MYIRHAMQDVTNFFKNLFNYDDFRAAWLCGNWSDFHGWFYILSDLLVWSAYFAIPITILVHAIRKGKSVRFSRQYFMLATFILVCGLTFFADALMFWLPMYRVNALLRFITGTISWLMVGYIVRNIPTIFSLRSGTDMQAEIATRIQIENELKEKNEQLLEAERIANLGYIYWDVINEKIEYSDSVYDILEVQKWQKLNYELVAGIVHPEDMKNIEKLIDTIFIKTFFPNFYCRVNTQNGVKHLYVVGQLILSPMGTIQAIKATIQDVTEQRLYIQKIQVQNQRLKDIAWIQSHKVRAPVASILGLVQLFNTDKPDDPVNLEILQGVTEAAHTLDGVIKEINAKTQSSQQTEDSFETI